MKTLYTTSASCYFCIPLIILLLSESIYISKGCEVVLQTRAHYKESTLSLFFSKISVPLPVSLLSACKTGACFSRFSCEQRETGACLVLLARPTSFLPRCLVCMHVTTSRPVSSDLLISGRPGFKFWTKHYRSFKNTVKIILAVYNDHDLV